MRRKIEILMELISSGEVDEDGILIYLEGILEELDNDELWNKMWDNNNSYDSSNDGDYIDDDEY